MPLSVGTSRSEAATDRKLPARFGYARNKALRGQLAKGEPGNLESADEPAASAAHLTTIDDACRAGVPWELRETGIVFLRLQLGPERSVFLRCRTLAFIPINPGHLGHRERGM